MKKLSDSAISYFMTIIKGHMELGKLKNQSDEEIQNNIKEYFETVIIIEDDLIDKK